MLNKIKGGLFGLAIGDALGAPTEFLKPSQIENKFGGKVTEMIGGGMFNWKPGETTDDTAMSLCVARGILNNKENPIEEIGNEFLNWFHSRPKDIGINTRLALKYYKMYKSWKEAALSAHDSLDGKSAGNGSLMRTLPIPLLIPDLEKAQHISMEQSSLTHYDVLAANCCSVYTEAITNILNGNEFKSVIEQSFSQLNLPKEELINPSVPSDGFVLHTFVWALHLCYTSKDFEEVVVRAANVGDDTDTIGAIAGGLYGTYCGYENLPIRYINALLNKSELEDISNQIYHFRNTQI